MNENDAVGWLIYAILLAALIAFIPIVDWDGSPGAARRLSLTALVLLIAGTAFAYRVHLWRLAFCGTGLLFLIYQLNTER